MKESFRSNCPRPAAGVYHLIVDRTRLLSTINYTDSEGGRVKEREDFRSFKNFGNLVLPLAHFPLCKWLPLLYQDWPCVIACIACDIANPSGKSGKWERIDQCL
jgi:hypothetical protein